MRSGGTPSHQCFPACRERSIRDTRQGVTAGGPDTISIPFETSNYHKQEWLTPASLPASARHMFFSVQHLIGREAKFGLVWRAATSGSTKKLPRRAVVEVSVPNMCLEMLNFVPSKRSEEADLTSKFSLYLLGQLVYGLVLIYDRQVTLFSFDVRAAFEACKRLPMEDLLNAGSPKSGKAKERSNRRRSKLETREHNPNIDVDEEPVDRFVCLARPCDITMVENEPVIWQRPDVFYDDGNQPPIDLSKQGFINWNELRSSGSSKESVEKVEENVQSQKQHAQVAEAIGLDEFPPLPPPEVFANMSREAFMAGSYLDLTADKRGDVQKSQSPPVVVNDEVDREPNAKRPRLDTQAKENLEVPAVEVNEAGPTHPSLELSPVNKEELDDHRVSRRRRNQQLFDSEALTISYESMKKLQLDYSSLLKTKEELRAGTTISKYPSLHELLLPYPAYAGKRFPKECIQLYRSRVCDTMTYQQALTESVFEPPDRGPSSKLWRYRSNDSSTESSVSDILPGIAFLKETPFRLKDGEEGRNAEERDYTLTPGKMTLKETPDRYKSFQNEQLDDLSLRVNDAVNQEQLQLAADISLQEEARVRQSHGSYVEEARRMTSGTSEFDRRPSSVQLLEPFHPGDVLEQSLQSSSGRFSLPDSLKEQFQQEECLRLIDALSNTSGYVPLSSIIPSTSCSKKRAAGLFSSLLRLLAHSVVTAEQEEAYSEIWVRACAASRSSDDDGQQKTLHKSSEVA